MRYLILLLLVATSYAQQTTIPVSEQIEEIRKEADELREEMELRQELNNQLIQIVTWSLSTTAGTLVVILGINWFQSRRVEKSERLKLKTELLEELKKDIDTLMESKSRSIEEKFEERAKAIENDLEERTDTLQGAVLSNMHRDLSHSIGEYLAEEDYLSALEGVVLALNFATQLDSTDAIAHSLENAQHALSMLGTIPSSLCAKLQIELDELPEEFISDSTALKTKLLELRSNTKA
ncbi:hypothetical protein [Pelagicoccus sp. SDUM812005]|uniref:hypothetical protein n=1 Tax=Pelagicoccus sp. SDUM812005 TaxID=3041257 RepID=UPI00280F67AA|nr:hypothetical protein [Pelagicoccus sp. SDUM812005]MDQ8183851.1 hypothetical protein [Pelagicoccus sp. SDUM812005]